MIGAASLMTARYLLSSGSGFEPVMQALAISACIVAFAEDKKILEAIQEQTDQQHNQNPVHISIDKGSIVYRRRIEELIKSETSFNPSA
jgi:hypothetical protein